MKAVHVALKATGVPDRNRCRARAIRMAAWARIAF